MQSERAELRKQNIDPDKCFAKKQTLTPSEKATVMSELDEIISQIGKLAERSQPDFKP